MSMPVPVPWGAALLLVLLLALLCACAANDLRERRIPNRLCLLIAFLAVPYWLAATPDPIHRLVEQAIIVAVAAPVLLLLYGVRAWGGGDAKLAAALLLWLPAGDVPLAGLVMAVAGGVIALAMLCFRREGARRDVPYGVAIVGGALVPLVGRLATMI